MNKTKQLVTASIIGAAYAALTMALSFISYGPIQFRVAEVLCILPFFFPGSVWGLVVGCALANFLMSGYGLPDVVFGSLATLLAGLCAAGVGKRTMTALDEGKGVSWGRCIAVCALPAIFNAPIIGAVISYSGSEYTFWQGFAIFGAQVGLGELVVMFVLGLPLMRVILGNEKLLGILRV